MFNTFLSEQRKMIRILFYWALFFASAFLVIHLIKQLKPETFTKEIVEYKHIEKEQFNLGRLSNGDLVKYGDIDMCISSIETSNLRKDDPSNPPVKIYLRKEGNCN